MSTSHQYALITGATSGIGYELALLFAKNQYNLVIVSRDQQQLEIKAQEFRQYGVNVVPIAKDLFIKDDAFSLCQEVRNMGIAVEVLVNDAGQGVYGLFKDTEIERELDIVNLNIASVIILTKFFLRDMISRNSGKILNVASIASKTPGPWQSVYHGTKAFLLSFSESIREEVKEYDITVTALMPGATDTDFFNKADMTESKAVQDESSLSDPADVAKDGYDALMAGTDKVISGFKNKVQIGMSNLLPDTVVAHNMNEMQKPVDSK